MDSVLNILQAFPPPPGKIGDNITYHKKVTAHVQSLEKLAKDHGFVSNAGKLLNHIHPARHSISYLATLTSRLKSVPKNGEVPEELLNNIVRFLCQYDQRQIRYVGETFSNLLNVVANGEILPASIAVDSLAIALQRLDPSGSILTSHHHLLAELAYKTGYIQQALPVLDKAIVSYPGITGSLNDQTLPADLSLSPPEYITIQSGLTNKLFTRLVLMYDLLSALCYISVRSWSKAFDSLERVLAYPTKDGGCSKIMVEAHNKWVLVGLLLEGSAPELPSTVSQSSQKTYATLGKPYYAIARAFEEKTAQNLKTEVESPGDHFWNEDGNLGLVREVVAHYQRWQILGLRDVYTKISLEEIRTSTQSGETAASLQTVDEVEALLNSMREEGTLDGEVVKPTDGKPAHLVFNDPQERSEATFGKDIVATAQRIKSLEPLIKATNERLATHRDYVKHLVREQKREKDQKNQITFDHVEEEDLMTGVQST